MSRVFPRTSSYNSALALAELEPISCRNWTWHPDASAMAAMAQGLEALRPAVLGDVEVTNRNKKQALAEHWLYESV